MKNYLNDILYNKIYNFIIKLKIKDFLSNLLFKYKNKKGGFKMGFRLNVEGPESINLGIENILTVEFKTDTPDDSNARSTDLGTTIVLTGKILTAVNGEPADETMKLAQWSLVPGEKADCYRKVKVDVISASQVVRQIELPNAFIVDYTEDYGDEEGIGTFYLHMKQKKDKTKEIKLEGGFAQ
jgi:hypothetical protein